VLISPCKNNGRCWIDSQTGGFPAQLNGGVQLISGGLALDANFYTWQCDCKYPYYGRDCSLTVTAFSNEAICASNPCQNGGVCTSRYISGGYSNGFFATVPLPYNSYSNYRTQLPAYSCSCPTGYNGINCELVLTQSITSQLCGTNVVCQNGGTCIPNGGLAKCQCPCGYAGDSCEVSSSNAVTAYSTVGRMNFCVSSPCKNGATCVNTQNGQSFLCLCKSGWFGTYCQNPGLAGAAAHLVPNLSVVIVAAIGAVVAALRS